MPPSPLQPSTTTTALLLAVLTTLLHTNPSAAQQSSSSSTLAAPELTAQAADNTIELTWTEVSGAARYELWVWTTAADWVQIGGDNLTATTFTHADLDPGTAYYYQIRAVAAGGVTGEWSQRLSVTVPGNLPAPVLTARALPGAVDLSWEPVTGAARYELWTWWDDDTGWQQLGGDNLTATTLSHTGLTAAGTYYYQMRAVDAGGVAGPWSQQVFAAFEQQQPPNATPTPTTTTEIATTPTPTSTATETHNELPAPTPSATSTATPSPTATPTPTPTATSAAPGFPAPILTAVAAEGTIELNWNAVPGAVRFELWYWTTAAGWQQLDNGDLTAVSFTHSGLSPGTTYYYSARAVNAAGDATPWSEYASAAPVPDGSPSPTPSPSLTPTPTPTSTQPAGASVQAPPASLNVHAYYRKYLDAGGIPILSSNDVTDEELYQARDTILAMLSDRPDILATMAEFKFRVLIYPDRFEKGGRLADLPEFSGLDVALRAVGLAGETPYGWVSGSPEVARHCNHTLIHEFAHQIEDALRLQPGGADFMSRLNSTYQAAMLTGLWQDRYASTSAVEYWAETVRAWLTPSQFAGWLGPGYQMLEDYDPVGAALVAGVLGTPTPLTFCEIRRFDLRGTVNLPDSRPSQSDTHILLLSIRSPAGAGRLLGASTAVSGPDGTFAFERLLIENLFLNAPGEKPHIVIGIYRRDIVGNAACPAAAFLGNDGNLVKSTDPARWKKLEVTGNHITGLSITIPPQFDWTPLHTCI
ncbi:MAG: hypothetical protein OXG98_17470 [Gemmatimonadetes bacterium]|nr:hypothetical protein [Gemmatimonadota bacterium]